MPLNGTDLINHPFNTTFKAYTDLLGSGFWLIPISFIAVALYVKTRNPVMVGVFLVGSGLLLSGGNLFASNPQMALVFTIFTVLSFVGLIASIYFIKK